MAVATDVAVLAPDDEQDELALPGVPEPPRRRRLDVAEPARPELEPLAVHLEAGPPAMDEVELVLLVVEVLEPVSSRRKHHRVHPERRHAERTPYLAEDPLAQLVDRRTRVRHRRRG